MNKWLEPEQIEPFCEDWDAGMTLAQLAEKYQINSVSNVSREAQRQGLPSRWSGRVTEYEVRLSGGRWVTRGGIKRWVTWSEKSEARLGA